MPSEMYDYGKRLGAAIAKDCRNEILKSGISNLPTVAGEKLDIVLRRIEKFISDSAKFREGFFDGFCDFAEIIIEAGKISMEEK